MMEDGSVILREVVRNTNDAKLWILIHKKRQSRSQRELGWSSGSISFARGSLGVCRDRRSPSSDEQNMIQFLRRVRVSDKVCDGLVWETGW